MNNKLDLPKAELQLGLGNTNPDATISLLDEFRQQVLATEQKLTIHSISFQLIYALMKFAVSCYTR